MATVSVPLKAEPARPEVRQEHHLAPKSYATAAGARENRNGDANAGADALRSRVSGTKMPKKASSSRAAANGVQKDKKGAQERLYEAFEDANGGHLTSIRPRHDADRTDEDEKEKLGLRGGEKDKLVSGRRAGAGWEKSGIRFAPLNVPLKRRLQTFIVLLHTLSIPFFLSLFFFLCAIPLCWPVLVPYLLYVTLSDAGASGTLARRSHRLRSARFWSLFASYFPARLHRSEELPPTRKYVFGYHPHGIISHGAFAAFATEAMGFSQLFPGITNTLLTLESNFRIPLYRDYLLAMGVGSVSRASCEKLLSKGGPNGEGMGRAITIVVGGAAESLDALPHSLRLVLKRRKGFVKLAIRTGADLVPVLAFGENELYEQVQPHMHPGIHRVQLLVKRLLGFTIPLFHARGVFNYDVGMLPYRRPLNVVVGRPLKVAQKERPDEAYVDEMHALYVEELERLWREWRDVFAKDRVEEMQIVE
ncbi:MAG: diacylglycerol O-acyltransferase 1 [Thelocarpon impressellum]|nr:MAG: diacylglycerol O-acyltransferase 1 [Thelocarpon impressellum]